MVQGAPKQGQQTGQAAHTSNSLPATDFVYETWTFADGFYQDLNRTADFRLRSNHHGRATWTFATFDPGRFHVIVQLRARPISHWRRLSLPAKPISHYYGLR